VRASDQDDLWRFMPLGRSFMCAEDDLSKLRVALRNQDADRICWHREIIYLLPMITQREILVEILEILGTHIHLDLAEYVDFRMQSQEVRRSLLERFSDDQGGEGYPRDVLLRWIDGAVRADPSAEWLGFNALRSEAKNL
jgi:hypothetical protein